MIEGLTKLEGPASANLAPHKFSLPPGFPANMSSNWVEDGQAVVEAQQHEYIPVANVKADGWAPYTVLDKKATDLRNEKIVEQFEFEQAALGDKRDSKAKPKFPPPIMVPYTRTVGKKTFVLMKRPKALQQAVNKIHADNSRALVSQEVRGETATVNEGQDPGVITNADLRRLDRGMGEEEYTYPLPTSEGGQPTRVGEAANIPVQ